MLSRNKAFGPPKKPNHWRRLAIGSWSGPSDPTLYGIQEFNVEKALQYLEAGKASGKFKYPDAKITITHFVGKVFAQLLTLYPDLNTELRFGKFYPRLSIDVSFQVAIDAGPAPDLSASCVRNVDQKDFSEVAKDLSHGAHTIRSKNDPGFKGVKRLSQIIPGFLQGFSVRILRWILSTLNVWSPLIGVPKDAFGSLLITNVGSLGIDFALPALFPPAGVPMIVAVGAIYKAPVYETDEAGNVLKTKLERHIRLCGAYDHRYLDGLHASKCAREMKKMFDHPEKVWGPVN